MRKTKILSLFVCAFYICVSSCFADTLVLKNGKEMKGIVVEDYKDRVVISTYAGEKIISKKNIENIIFDLPEQNLIKLGDTYLARREYEKAYFYYERAHRTNPGDKAANDKMNYIMGYLFRKQEQDKINAVKRRQALEEWGGVGIVQSRDYEKELKDAMGLAIAEEGGRILISDVKKNSAAEDAGLKKGDNLISVWGRLTGYMPAYEVARLLLEESSGEIKIGIEREIAVKKGKRDASYQNIIGGKLGMLINGLTVTDLEDAGPGRKAGLLKGDEIIAINGTPTRYMPFKEAVQTIQKCRGSEVTFNVARDATLWRK